MLVYLILVILCVSFTWFKQIGSFKNGLKVSYFLIFLFLALRFDYGNDYAIYYNDYLSLQSLEDEDFYYKANEVGWLYLNYIFKYVFGDLGFYVMIAAIASFTCYVFYRFTIKYIPSTYYAFGTALLLLEPNNILVLSSGIRQAIAVAIFLLSFEFLTQKKYLYYVTGLIFASIFHTSALVFIALIALNIINWRIYFPYVIIVFFVLIIMLNNLTGILNQINIILESQESIYVGYTNDGQILHKYGLGFALYVFIYLSILALNRNSHRIPEQNTVIKTVLVMLFLTIVGIAVHMIGRLSFYIYPIVVSAYSITLFKLSNMKFSNSPLISKFAGLTIVVFFAYQNYLFWYSEVYGPYFREYKSIFQSPLW
jgi:hypothetical protein